MFVSGGFVAIEISSLISGNGRWSGFRRHCEPRINLLVHFCHCEARSNLLFVCFRRLPRKPL